MHLKVFLKLKKPKKLSLRGKYIKKPKKKPKKPQNPPKTKTLGWFFFNPDFFQPCLLQMTEEADQEAALLQGNGGLAAVGEGGHTTTGLINMAQGLLRLA
jgi:hypothetical protein